MKNPELLPCPFCGNKEPELIDITTIEPLGGVVWRVGCNKCGSYNNLSKDKERAVAQWNMRTKIIS